MTLAVDLSNYSGELTEQQAAGLYASGVRRAIVQTVNERVLTHRQQIPALLAAGIEVEAYVYLWFSEGPQFSRDRIAWSCRELSAFPAVRRLWLDCEQSPHDDPPYEYDPAVTVETIKAAALGAEVRGYEVGIYTAAWWWDAATGRSSAFSAYPLWVAKYDGNQTREAVKFGGWGVPAMKQYQGTSILAGVPNVDLNSYEDGATVPAPLPGGEFLPEPVEASDLGKIAADLVYGVKQGRVDLVEHGPSPAREGWTRLTVDYLT